MAPRTLLIAPFNFVLDCSLLVDTLLVDTEVLTLCKRSRADLTTGVVVLDVGWIGSSGVLICINKSKDDGFVVVVVV